MTFRHVVALLTISMTGATAAAFQPQMYLAGEWAPAMQDSAPRSIDSKAAAKDAIPTLTGTGEAELRGTADQVQIRLGVVTDATEAAAAMQDNSKRMNDVMA